jgi:3-oxoacyl-[acyl-carrier-protein] synthase II
MSRRVVITGLGCVSPCGNDVPNTWDAMLGAKSGLGRITRFSVEGARSTVGGEVKDLDLLSLLGPRVVRRSGLFVQYAMVAADEAMRDAGFEDPSDRPDGERMAVYVGSGIGGLPEIVEGALTFFEEGMRGLSPLFIPRCLINLATGQLAIRYGARGPSLVVSTACAVGNHAIGEAWRLLKWGEADVAIAGGTEASLIEIGFGGFMAMRALSKGTDSTASRPFDKTRDGFVMSEGAGIVVLEDLDHAVARGARIYCEVVGYALTTDAHHVTAPSPGGDGAARCMRRALELAGVSPDAVGYVNAHGTSTPANDPTETQAIRTVFGAHADAGLAVSSTKGVTGHLLGAAGGLEAVATAMSLHTGWVPPTAHLRTPDPECDLDYVPEGRRRLEPEFAISNGFGFGGTNATLVFRRWEGR